MTEDLPPITLPAEFVIPAWRNAYLAASDNDGLPALYRTVHLEWYDDGLRFVSTDTYVLVASYAHGDRWADAPVLAPDHDEPPLGAVTAIAADLGQRADVQRLIEQAASRYVCMLAQDRFCFAKSFLFLFY